MLSAHLYPIFHSSVVYQIKNIVAIAHALATKKNITMAFFHVRQTVKASESFIREFNGTNIVESLYN